MQEQNCPFTNFFVNVWEATAFQFQPISKAKDQTDDKTPYKVTFVGVLYSVSAWGKGAVLSYLRLQPKSLRYDKAGYHISSPNRKLKLPAQNKQDAIRYLIAGWSNVALSCLHCSSVQTTPTESFQLPAKYKGSFWVQMLCQEQPNWPNKNCTLLGDHYMELCT